MMGRMKKEEIAAHRGFSLIELLMVISIISLITSIVIASLVNAREKARIAKAKVEMRQVEQAMVVAQGEMGKTLVKIVNGDTGSHLPTDSGCESGDMTEFEGQCIGNWFLVLSAIENSSGGLYSNFDLWNNFQKDPWGKPYVLHVEQGFNGAGCTTNDRFMSAGPDRELGNADDLLVLVPLSAGCP